MSISTRFEFFRQRLEPLCLELPFVELYPAVTLLVGLVGGRAVRAVGQLFEFLVILAVPVANTGGVNCTEALNSEPRRG